MATKIGKKSELPIYKQILDLIPSFEYEEELTSTNRIKVTQNVSYQLISEYDVRTNYLMISVTGNRFVNRNLPGYYLTLDFLIALQNQLEAMTKRIFHFFEDI